MELPADLLREQLRERVAGLRVAADAPRRSARSGRLALEREPEDGLARSPDDAPKPVKSRRLEDVEGAEHVRAERHLLGVDPGGRNGRQVHDRVDAAQRFDGLAELGQIGDRDVAEESAGGTMSTASTSWSCSSRSRTTARPAFPLPPVTTTFTSRSLGGVPRGRKRKAPKQGPFSPNVSLCAASRRGQSVSILMSPVSSGCCPDEYPPLVVMP